MKKIIIIIAFILSVLSIRTEAKPGHFEMNFGIFYSSLSPHGEWLEFSSGVYGWRPYRISYGWRPYSNGRWTWTSYGWYWDSYEPYGWATYHYGRWFYDDYYGWLWIPDYTWGPSWVEWRYDDDYIGWAPLSPYAGYRYNSGIYFSFNWVSPYHYWNFISINHFCHSHVHRYLINDGSRYRIYNNSRYRNDYRYDGGRVINSGLDKSFVERRTRTTIDETRVISSSRLRGNSGERERGTVERYQPDQEAVSRANESRYRIKQVDRNTKLDVSKVETSRDKGEIEKRTIDRRSDSESRQRDPNMENQPIERRRTDQENIYNRNRDSEKDKIREPERRELQPAERWRNNEQRNNAPEPKRPEVRTERTEPPRIERKREEPKYERIEQPRIERRSEEPRREQPRIERPNTDRPSRNESGESRTRNR